MATKSATPTKKVKIATPKATIAVTPATKPNLPSTLDALQFLRTAKNKSDNEINSVLDKALAECTKNDIVSLLEKVMLHIGDISRQHNILRESGIVSATGGAQERVIFRAVMRWWAEKLPVSFKENLPLFAEFTLYENLMYYQITTDRLKGNVTKQEVLMPHQEYVWAYLASQIQKGKDLALIAKHLPKHETAKSRVTKKIAKALRGATSYEWTLPKGKAWVKVNGAVVNSESGKVTLKTGDKITYPRAKQSATLVKQLVLNRWIEGFCKVLDWDLKTYSEFRGLQNTPEQLFSSQKIKEMPKSDFMQLLDRLTSGQRFRVAKMVAYKDTSGNLQAKPKWGDLGAWYIEWEKGQEKVATKLREAFASVEYFVSLVEKGTFNVEQLPNALLFLTDGENNTGKSPKEAMKLANSIGWNPLIIYWGIQSLPHSLKNEKIPNCLWVSGFSEGALSQILRGIKGGSVDPQEELWALFENKRYSLIAN